MPMALFTHPPSTLSIFTSKPNFKPHLTHLFKKSSSLLLARSTDNGAGVGVTAAVEEKVVEKKEEVPSKELKAEVVEKKKEEVVESNGASVKEGVITFSDPRWVGGTWDLKQFGDVGKTDWDAVIEAEARRRKFLEDNPESSNNENPVIFDTSIIPWWAWVKKYHLPEAELLNGRAAMIGFFMAYFVDSLTGVGLVNQMGNFFCKTLLFVAVVGVLVIRKNEDFETVKKLIEETTFYDKQWQATWKDDTNSDSNKE